LTVVNTSPGAVLTYHNDDARDGAFTAETTLMPSVVNSTQFGKLRSYPVDGQLYAQPLFIPQLAIGGTKRNVVFAATENDTVYAFDADGTQTAPLWSVSLGAPSPRNDAEGVNPVIGITSTPVIDVTTNTMYVVAQTISGPFLHALDITSGAEKLGGPVFITGTVPGTGWDSAGGALTLERGCYQRNGLALNPVNNWIYLGFGHCNHGWLLAYDKTTLMQKAIFNDTPDGAGGGFWNSGGAPAIDDQNGEVYFMSGVDAGDPPSGYNDSFLRLSVANLSVEDFFQPDDESFLAANDADLGSGAPILMPDNPTNTPHEIIGGGKDGRIFVVNRDNMGAFSSTINNVIETVQTGVKQIDNIFSTPGYWNGFLYYHCEGDILRSFTWSNGEVSQQPVSIGQPVLSAHGATVSVSANGTNNGIVWEIDNSAHGSAGPAILRAYDATNLTTELYDSAQAGSRDTAGLALKFTVPTVGSGKVFVGTTNELDIYGLLGH
jgi:dTDP-4-dehydrorhamnose 3,5-epimerase-like enzyme